MSIESRTNSTRRFCPYVEMEPSSLRYSASRSTAWGEVAGRGAALTCASTTSRWTLLDPMSRTASRTWAMVARVHPFGRMPLEAAGARPHRGSSRSALPVLPPECEARLLLREERLLPLPQLDGVDIAEPTRRVELFAPQDAQQPGLREGGASGDPLRGPLRGGERIVVDLVEEAERIRAAGIDEVPREQQVARPRLADRRGEPTGGAGRVDESQLRGGDPEARSGSGDADVARGGQLRAAA